MLWKADQAPGGDSTLTKLGELRQCTLLSCLSNLSTIPLCQGQTTLKHKAVYHAFFQIDGSWWTWYFSKAVRADTMTDLET